jgi:hypothetical protein
MSASYILHRFYSDVNGGIKRGAHQVPDPHCFIPKGQIIFRMHPKALPGFRPQFATKC